MAGAGPDYRPKATLADLIAAHIDRMSMANTAGGMPVGELARQMMLLDALVAGPLHAEKGFHADVAAAWDEAVDQDLSKSAAEAQRWYRVLGVTLRWLYEKNVLKRAPDEWESLDY